MSKSNIQDNLLVELENINLTHLKDSQYAERRLNAKNNFLNLGFPTPKNEDWKYSDLKGLSSVNYEVNASSDLNKEQLESLAFGNAKGIKIVVVNGVIHKDLCDLSLLPSKIEIFNLEEAIDSKPELVNQHFGNYIDTDSDGTLAHNLALGNQGLVINVLDNFQSETPIIIYNISDVKEKNSSSVFHNLFLIGKNSEVKFVEIFSTVGQLSSFENLLTEIVIEKDAKVDYYKIQDQNDNSFHIGTTQVIQNAKSYFYSATVTLNGGFVRNNLNVVLEGEYIDNHLFGLYIPNGKQHIDNHTLVDHKYPNSQSNELYKGVLMDKSTGVFNGKIFVREDAQKTNAYQNCRNVITSDSATMNSKPQLEIWADDVKCSHGTTTGKLNDEAIFYMQSRGIPKADAIKLQLLAFAEDVVSQIKIDEIREELEKLIEIKLG
jgi:Fe-S cluster assembly protein SufD